MGVVVWVDLADGLIWCITVHYGASLFLLAKQYYWMLLGQFDFDRRGQPDLSGKDAQIITNHNGIRLHIL